MFQRSMRAAVAAVALIAATAPPIAHAEPAASASEPSARSLELARRLMKAMQVEAQVDTALQHMLPLQTDSPEFRSLPAGARDMILDTIREVMRDSLTPKLVGRMTPEYAKAFSESELETAVTFYESPAGQSMLAKTPQLMGASAAAVRDLLPEAQAEVMRRICEKVDCKGEKPKKS